MTRHNNRLINCSGVLAVIILLLTGCGIHRQHEFAVVEDESSKPVGGWVVTPSLVQFEQGSTEDVEEYSLIINAMPTPDIRRYRLGIDSVEFILPGGGKAQSGHLKTFENRQTEAEPFTRRLTGVRFVTSIQEITCRVHMTLITLETGERWSRSADYRIKSRWHKKFWFGKRKQ